ncbi:MAG: MmgE/PrpD family protein [Burkholderiales bacterium]|nr:MmgE/PrpD family protein [Burkholderiales bacterium]
MDKHVGAIAEFACALRFEDLPSVVVQHCKRCMIDTVGVALGGYQEEPCRIARDLAARADVSSGARIIGSARRTLPELAAFANGVMIRYLDSNDCFPGRGGHPSDAIPAVLAMADVHCADGRAIITAMTLAYEIHYNLWKTGRVFDNGIDHVFYTTLAGAVGAAKVMGLGRKGMEEAISLAVAPNIALAATRYGELSMWKGLAGGNAVRNGVFAAELAASGVSGPEKPLEGEHGLEKLISGLELLPFPGQGGSYGIERITLKSYPVAAPSLAPVTVAIPLSRQVAFRDIEKVTVFTYWAAWEINGREPEKWRPTTREAADHSLPYIVAAILIDGGFSEEMFSEERLADQRIRTLIDKVEVKEDPELTRRFPECMPCRIEIRMRNGEVREGSTDYPRGHDRNPMSDDEISGKFREFARHALVPARLDQALDVLWQLDQLSGSAPIFNALMVD